jgi:hypothetical protein
MRFAEVFLRMGTALVAWMMLFTHFVWLAVLHSIGCGPDGDEMHRLLFGLAPFTILFAFLLRVTRPIAEVHSMLRWLGVPVGLLLLLGLRSIWGVASQVNFGTTALCGPGEPALWQQAWAPLQFIVALVAGYIVTTEIKRAH